MDLCSWETPSSNSRWDLATRQFDLVWSWCNPGCRQRSSLGRERALGYRVLLALGLWERKEVGHNRSEWLEAGGEPTGERQNATIEAGILAATGCPRQARDVLGMCPV